MTKKGLGVANYDKRLMRVLRYIHDNPAGDMSLDRLADEAAMSRFHWHRIFHAMTGETCAQAVRRVRLHKAACLLLLEDAAPDEISRAVGYDNPRSFGRAFASQYGASPAKFRKQGVHVAPLMTRKEGEGPMFPVSVREEPPRVIAGVVHKGAYSRIGTAFEAFFGLCEANGLWPRLGNPVGIYFDNPEAKPEPDLRSMAGAELRLNEVPEDLEGFTISGGRYAVLTLRGPYDLIPQGYDALFGKWLPESGEMPGDAPCFEIYLNSPLDTKPEDLLTEICLPLAEKPA
ncbi:AraC family transcriptional regulator [Shimia isoporae]|uniref:AraC family transcriptional regulator n=1 Tax=Shimia isoporae TaxID=647720 RepID=A0A4R1N2P6_9RHOB|nr:AraC family transcriptional regulator [Shimia isoporae]TCL00589.1 AraC family transcriptional regulator [Shimia isoporae]